MVIHKVLWAIGSFANVSNGFKMENRESQSIGISKHRYLNGNKECCNEGSSLAESDIFGAP